MALISRISHTGVEKLFQEFTAQVGGNHFSVNEFCLYIYDVTGFCPIADFDEHGDWLFKFFFEDEQQAVEYKLKWL